LRQLKIEKEINCNLELILIEPFFGASKIERRRND
jgi:hypothetical protein